MIKRRKDINKKANWIKFIIILVLYLAFLYWVKSWLGLLIIPLIYDAYISKKINWQWWKDREGPVRFIMGWVDAIVFAMIAVYFINIFFFQNYVIPTSSLEKSLLTGDYLFVSKLSYGARIPQTPLTMPLTQHTLPVLNIKSYIDIPHWDYRRVKGLGNIKLNDIVVFNYPSGDTLVNDTRYQAADYYQMVYALGTQLYERQHSLPCLDSLDCDQQRAYYDEVYRLGSLYVKTNPSEYGEVITRPTDRRENYVKRCVGMPGQTLQIKNRIIYLDSKPNKEPDNVQYTYRIKLKQNIPSDLLEAMGSSNEDLTSLNQAGYMPLTQKAYKMLSARKDIVQSISINDEAPEGEVYPLNANTHWTRDNYGPITIPRKGMTITLDMHNIAIYERPIKVYEENKLEIKNHTIYINDKPTDKYTFKMDYYWMMGDNRHNSADSRYWGFVPEDHIVGKPIFIWWSKDPDKNGFSGIRWNRICTLVDNIK